MLVNMIRERKHRNLRQQDIADMLGVAISTYCYWEKGRNEPDLTSLKKLAKYYNCSIDYLIANEESEVENKMTAPQSDIIDKVLKLNEIDCLKVQSYIQGLLDKTKSE